MKKAHFLIIAIFLSSILSSQGQYPITTIFKGDTVVILTKKQSEEINGSIESANKKINGLLLELKNRETKLKKIEKKFESFKITLDSINESRSNLNSFKNDVLKLATTGVLLYQRNDTSYCYINLRSYKWTIFANDKIVLTPIFDRSKWKAIRIADVPQSDNLSLHLWPHTYFPDKLKIQKK